MDITLCTDNSCPSKLSCTRFMEEPEEHQSFTDFSYFRHGEDECEYFIKQEKIMKHKENHGKNHKEMDGENHMSVKKTPKRKKGGKKC